MKSVIFLADGMADERLAELDNRTPLEACDTPAMDSIARRGSCGTFLTLPDGLPTSSDVANMSVLGFDPERFYPGRGPIEAVSQNIVLGPDDVAWRCNLVSVSPEGILLDYSADHIDQKVAAELMEMLQRELGSKRATFHSGVSYRNLLVLHGKEFSNAIHYHKPDSSQDLPVSELELKANDGSPEARYTVEFLAQLSARATVLLEKHPLFKSGQSRANYIWPWSPGRQPQLPSFAERYPGKHGAIISAVDVIKGIGKCTGMNVIEVPGATGYIDTNYDGKVQAALKALETNDFVYIHVEAIDECSHSGNLELKMRAITDFDAKIVAPVLKALEGQEVRFAVLPDHPVPIKLRCHTTDPVPVALCGPGIAADDCDVYSEMVAPKGALGAMRGMDLMRLVLGLR